MEPDREPRLRRGARGAVLVGEQLVRLCSPLVPGLETVAALTDTSEIKDECRALTIRLVGLRKACVELLCGDDARRPDGSNLSGSCEAFLRSAEEIAVLIECLQSDIASSRSFRRQEYRDAVADLSNQLSVVFSVVASGRAAVASASLSSDLSDCMARVREANDILEQLVVLFFDLDQAFVKGISRMADEVTHVRNEIREIKSLFFLGWGLYRISLLTGGSEVPPVG